MKKILLAVLICAISAFADWHQFPVIGESLGEAKIAVYQSRQGDSIQKQKGPGMDYFRLRYSPIANLELLSEASLKTGANHILGARYQIIPALSAGVNIGVPIPKTNWNFTPHIQFSTPLTSALTWGNFVRVTFNTEDAYDYTRGVDLRAGTEFDLRVGPKSVLWAGCDVGKGLSKSDDNGTKVKLDGVRSNGTPENRGLGIYPAFGYLITLGNMSLGTLAVLGFGEDAGNKPLNTTVGASASVRF
ncbi:MAG: hypothetical protein LBQ87_05330 [Candidatus Fibromonas sp.]|jgi:hypothetical protein|nr:hypothetical protein [Candidatus Fibromonas sp.]